jgi:hypothetical protein
MRFAPLLAVLSAGCWEIAEQARTRRVWEMQDHADDLAEARDAVRRGDLGAARQSGVWLSEPDRVPGLPPQALRHLEAVRADGRALIDAADLPSAARLVTATTADCAACHRQLAVAAPPPLKERDAAELLWLGLAFESEERWAEGVAATHGAAPAGASWDERRGSVAATLLQGR